MSGEILFLAHRIPFPPDRGDKIRSHHVLKALAELAPVHVGCLAESEEDRAAEAQLAAVASSHWMPTRRKPLPVAGVEALISKTPVSLAAFGEGSLRRWVRHTLAERPISAIYVFSGQMGQYVPRDWQGRLVVDLVDVDSVKFEAYALRRFPPLSWVYRREGRLLRAVESNLVARADVALLVSDDEAALMRSRSRDSASIRALGNGIDCATFDPAQVAPAPELAAQPGPHFVFTGQMDYAPNVAAVQRFAGAILPQIRQQHGAAQFHIVGRAPGDAVRKLGNRPGVKVHGAVPDMRPWLAGADLVVAPLTIARGVQNKVLEAMAMARTVLVSPEAATGIPAVNGEHLLVCDGDAQFVTQALAMLECPGDSLMIGQAARKFVSSTMSWPAMLAPLPKIMGLPAGEGRRDAA